MTKHNPTYLNKIVNPDLARVAMRSNEPRGAFKAFVRLAKPPKQSDVLELLSPGCFKFCIPCNEIESFAQDKNVISIELREHITSNL
ncbi:MAG: hypothetical protein WAO98_05695 [Alphaproteobacteria bacterium]